MKRYEDNRDIIKCGVIDLLQVDSDVKSILEMLVIDLIERWLHNATGLQLCRFGCEHCNTIAPQIEFSVDNTPIFHSYPTSQTATDKFRICLNCGTKYKFITAKWEKV